MSDPVSNAEIEDVLSSIRRLVSEDPSPLNRRKKISEGAKERFVLTPALRVADDEADAVEATEEAVKAETDAGADEADAFENAAAVADTDGMPDAQTGDSVERQERFAESRQTLEQRIAELEAALQQSPDEWEPDGSEVAASDAPEIPAFADVDVDDTEATEDMETAVWEADPEDAADRSEALADEEEADLADLAEAEDAVEAAEEIAAFDDPEDDMAEAEADVTEAVFEALADEDPIEDEPAGSGSEDVGSAADVLYGRDRRAGPTTPGSDDHENDPETAEAEELPLDAQPDGAQAGPADDEDEDEDEPFELFDDAVLDEAALRGMVSQMVLDELQGVMGERITRNVRRLVRREIQRAIAMRDLE